MLQTCSRRVGASVPPNMNTMRTPFDPIRLDGRRSEDSGTIMSRPIL